LKPISPQRAQRLEGIIPNPKLKLLNQAREVLRLKHYSIRTERCYCDWIRRYMKFHHMRLRARAQKLGLAILGRRAHHDPEMEQLMLLSLL
jgi:integrase-like protein